MAEGLSLMADGNGQWRDYENIRPKIQSAAMMTDSSTRTRTYVDVIGES
jgi:hypothetical protein